MIVDRLGVTPLITQLPIGSEAGFVGVVDLVKNKAIVWKDDTVGAEFYETDIPADLQAKAADYRAKLLSIAVEQDDAATNAYLAGNEPSIETLKACIRKGTIAGALVPVLCGSAFKNKGIQQLLNAVVDYLPSPLDVAAKTNAVVDDNAPFAGLAFKIMTDPFVGSLTFVRIYSGTLTTGSKVLNSVKGQEDRVGRMLLMHGERARRHQRSIRGRHRPRSRR